MKTIIIVFLMLITGCATTIQRPIVEIKDDPYTGGRTIIQNSKNVSAKNPAFRGSYASFSIWGIRETPDSEMEYSLTVEFISERWMFIPEGVSLIFLVDGERVPLTTDHESTRDVLYGSMIHEGVFYKINKETMLKIASGKIVSCKLHIAEFDIPELVKQNWLNYINNYWE